MNHKKQWHTELSQAVLDLDNFSFSCHGDTHYIEEIRQYTDNYLCHAEELLPRNVDDHLKGLISEHTDKIQAVLACTHVLSHFVLREYLQTIGKNAQKEQDVVAFVKTVVIVHTLKGQAISAPEKKWGDCLKELVSADPDGIQAVFQSYDELIIRESVPPLFTPHMLQGILQIAIKRLGLRLEQWKEAGELTKAYQNSRWMRKVSSSLSHLKSILDDNVQYWESWAAWVPSLLCLQALNELSTSQRMELHHIFALEGPDFNSSPPKTNLLSALVSNSKRDGSSEIRHGILHFRWGNGNLCLTDLADSLLKKIVKAYKTSDHFGAIMSYIVRSNIIDEFTLELLNSIEKIDPLLISTTFKVVISNTRETRLQAVKKIIPALASSENESLRRSLSSLIGLTIHESISAFQDKFKENLTQGKSLENISGKLDSMGDLLRNNLWLRPLIDPEVWFVVSSYPSRQNMETLFELREQVATDETDVGIIFTSLFDRYCISTITGQGIVDVQGRILIQHLLDICQKEPSLDRRRLAINMAQRSSIPTTLRCKLFEDIRLMSEDFCEIVIRAVFYGKEQGCLDLAQAIATDRKMTPQEKFRWQSVLKSMMEMQSSNLVDYAVMNLDIREWFKWVRDNRSNSELSKVFNSALFDWAARLERTQMEALASLEKIIGTYRLRKILPVPENEELVIIFLEMVKENDQDCELKPIYDQILARLAPDWSNLPQLGELISQLHQASKSGKNYCLQLVENWKTLPLESCQGILQIWLNQEPYSWLSPSEVTQGDLEALQQVSILLGLDIADSDEKLTDCLTAAHDHLNQRYEQLLGEASRLNSIRRILKAHNLDEAKEFLAAIGVADIDEGIVDIPISLADVVERHGFREFEVTFPLSHLKPLQRFAMGVGGARNLIVRLNLNLSLENEVESRAQFCVHMDPEETADVGSKTVKTTALVGEHYYWVTDSGSPAPDLNFCTGRGNRTTYLVSMVLWRHFSTTGFHSLETVHDIVSNAILDNGENCLVCGEMAEGFRATTCDSFFCNNQFRQADYELRLSELLVDLLVIELLLLGVFAATQNGRLDFLDPCPIGDKSTISHTMAGLPALHILDGASDIQKSIKSLGLNTEALILWMASYDGFLASATGLLKIPNLLGVHQFVLVRAPTEVETQYRRHESALANTSQVVFHGTSMDRLFPILRQGFQVGTGTSLQQHGASFGSGIYCATDPAMSMHYALASPGWPNSKFGNTKVIFGCELYGSHSPVSPGIYVIPDPTQLRVRYIFLFPSAAAAPLPQHVTPAMQSAFALLRSGQV